MPTQKTYGTHPLQRPRKANPNLLYQRKHAMRICVLGNQARATFLFWRVLMCTAMERGHSVLCLVPDGDEENSRRIRDLGVDLRHYSLDRKGLSPANDMRTFLELRKIFSSENIDLLFASTIKPVIYGCMAAKNCGIPHIYATITGLGYAFEADTLFKKVINRLSISLYRTALAGIEGVFFQNRDDADLFGSCGILRKDARVLFARGTGVDCEHFAATSLPATDSGLVFLSIGRLLEAKGFREFVEAARMVRQKYPAASFRILGPKEQGLGSIGDEEIASWAGSVDYLGATSDVRPYVADAHVIVLASWREGTPTAIMEAMSMGRPCIVTDVPGCREVVRDGQNGLLVKVKDPQSLAAAMERLCADPQSLAAMGASGRELATGTFDAGVVARGILDDMHVPDRA